MLGFSLKLAAQSTSALRTSRCFYTAASGAATAYADLAGLAEAAVRLQLQVLR
jgi:hypothetical protein